MPLTTVQTALILIALFWLLGEVKRCKRVSDENMMTLRRIEEKIDSLMESTSG